MAFICIYFGEREKKNKCVIDMRHEEESKIPECAPERTTVTKLQASSSSFLLFSPLLLLLSDYFSPPYMFHTWERPQPT